MNFLDFAKSERQRLRLFGNTSEAPTSVWSSMICTPAEDDSYFPEYPSGTERLDEAEGGDFEEGGETTVDSSSCDEGEEMKDSSAITTEDTAHSSAMNTEGGARSRKRGASELSDVEDGTVHQGNQSRSKSVEITEEMRKTGLTFEMIIGL